jgi:hypothetical protein
LLLKTGFHRAALRRYTGFKSSPYTEGALFYGEKPIAAHLHDAIASQSLELAEFKTESVCEPGSA